MLEFKDGDIILTRGDSVYIDTVILTPCEEVYEPRENDEVYFYILRENEEKIVLKKKFNNRKTVIKEIDTKFLNKGKYRYNCVLIQENGDRQTYCEGNFFLV